MPPSVTPTSEEPEPLLDRGPMIYGEPRPFKTCKVSSRVSNREKGWNDPHYSPYEGLKDFHQGGTVEIRVKAPKNGERWATTRLIEIKTLQAPHIECLSIAFEFYSNAEECFLTRD